MSEAEVWTRETLNDLLLLPQNARVAAFYFGDGRAIEGTVPLPLALDRSSGRDLQLQARAEQVRELRDSPGDVIIVGPAGSGKSRLAAEADDVRFVSLHADENAVAESLRIRQPRHVVLDDAGLDLDRLTMLLELRREGYQFDIIATTWEEHIELVGSLMPDARRIRVPLISRNEMDGLLRSLGVVNYYYRTEILDQAAGRPGWAVHLAAAAMEVPSVEVFSGRALVKHIGSYLHRLGPAATQSLSLLGVLAAIGPVDVDTEMARLDDFLGIGMLQRLALLREAAAVGLLDQRGQRLSVAPHALQPALFAHVFFDGSVPLSVMELLEAWLDRRERILDSLIAAARASDRARDALELTCAQPVGAGRCHGLAPRGAGSLRLH